MYRTVSEGQTSHHKIVFIFPETQTTGETGCEDSLVSIVFCKKDSVLLLVLVLKFKYTAL